MTNTARITAVPSGGRVSRVTGTASPDNTRRIGDYAGFDGLALEGDMADGLLLVEGDMASTSTTELLLEGDMQGGVAASTVKRI